MLPVSGFIFTILLVTGPASSGIIVISDPNPGLFDRFGSSVDSANGLLAVGATGAESSPGVGSGLVWVLNARTGSLITTVVSPNAERGGQFGWSVKLGRHLLIVGAPSETLDGIAKAGRVYVFEPRTGSLVRILVSPHPESNGFFGSVLKENNGRLYVGASIESANGVRAAGHVYAFDIDTGSLISTFVSPNPQQGGVFGIAIDVGQGRLIVGAEEGPPSIGTLQGQGRAYIFNATTGSLISTLLPTFQTQYFGNSVAILDQQAFVGAFAETVGDLQAAGRVYVFNVTTGSVIRTFVSPNIQTEGFFGDQIELSNERMIISASGDRSNGANGRIYIFDMATQTLTSMVVSPHPSFEGQFGFAVNLANDRLYVGAPGETANSEPEAGNLYIFRMNSSV